MTIKKFLKGLTEYQSIKAINFIIAVSSDVYKII